MLTKPKSSPYYIIDAFITKEGFSDNPAGICSFIAEANKENVNTTAYDIEYGKTSVSFKNHLTSK